MATVRNLADKPATIAPGTKVTDVIEGIDQAGVLHAGDCLVLRFDPGTINYQQRDEITRMGNAVMKPYGVSVAVIVADEMAIGAKND